MQLALVLLWMLSIQRFRTNTVARLYKGLTRSSDSRFVTTLRWTFKSAQQKLWTITDKKQVLIIQRERQRASTSKKLRCGNTNRKRVRNSLVLGMFSMNSNRTRTSVRSNSWRDQKNIQRWNELPMKLRHQTRTNGIMLKCGAELKMRAKRNVYC